MYKYIFTLATLLNNKSRAKIHYSPDTVISDLFDENLDEIDWILTLSELELIYGFEIPDELYDLLFKLFTASSVASKVSNTLAIPVK